MNVNNMVKKFFTLWITLLLVLSFNLITTSPAKFTEYNDEGIWLDDFTDMTELNLVNCTNVSDTIILNKGVDSDIYSYQETPKKIEAWYHDQTLTPRGPIAQFISLLVDPSLIPGTKVEEEMSSIGTLGDDERLATKALALSPQSDYTCYPMHHFQFKISQKLDYIKNVTIKWWFGDYVDIADANIDEITMYIWTYGDILERWGDPQTISYNNGTVGSSEANPNIDLYFVEDDYISDDGLIDILVMGNPETGGENAYLYTDYIEAKVEIKHGFLQDGYVTSKVIDLSSYAFGGWESVFWESTRPSSRTSVTLQVLDEDEEVIEGVSGTSSPLDISSVEQDKIMLRAVLHSESPDITPRLYSWGLTWQKTNKFRDNFSNTFRIDETLGTKVENNQVTVSEYYSDWATFGKNSANTRSYIGKGIDSKPEEVYWYTDRDEAGGGFRGVVASNGLVYVSAPDKKIYAFNMKADSTTGEQDPVDSSSAGYVVDSAIGIADNTLVIGTCEGGKANKVYGLNASDLTDELWEYSYNDKIICFSAPPTIDEGRVFISSWSGMVWDIPLLSFLNPILKRNNKLIALDLTSGDQLWEEAASLPAGSLSAPAVGNGLVYVGCQNMYGSSLYAFEADTGEEAWNTTIGIIGRSSPVYGDGKIFVLSREKNMTSSGINKLSAVDANSGKILWNKTIGDHKGSTIFNIINGLDFYSMISGSAPISTPAYYDNTLYVLAPNGTLLALDTDGNIKWYYDISSSLVISHYITSPIVIGDTVYAVTGKGKLFAFNTKNTGATIEPKWSYEISTPTEYIFELPPEILASPIIADGLLIVSSTTDTLNLTGRLYCVGDYSPNKEGTVVSTSIHVPTGYWWDTFKANHVDSENNTIVFSVLDGDGEVIPGLDNLNGSATDVSNINTNVIKLKASFEIGNFTETLPALNSWEVNWTSEAAAPVFDEDSFEPGEEGWINLDLPECSIEVEDQADNGILSGIDTSSGKYKISYVPKGKEDPVKSKWFTAASDDDSGVTTTRITAMVSSDLEEEDIQVSELKNITFSIKDLAGNSESYTSPDFNVDTGIPSSNIANKNAIEEEKFTVPVEILADAEDVGESGVSSVMLRYAPWNETSNDWDSWMDYSASTKPYSWAFSPTSSNYYKVITIANDKAGNKESIVESKAVTLWFDDVLPSLDSTFDSEYKSEELPSFNIEVSDDYMLDAIYYRLDSETEWKLISTEANDIDDKNYSEIWTLPQDIWVNMAKKEQHYVYFRITDFCGNEYNTTATNSPLIIKDENVTRFHLDVSDFKDIQWDDEFEITLDIPSDVDAKEVKLYYNYSSDDKDWSGWKQYGETLSTEPFTWTFKAEQGSGYYKFYTEIIDTSDKVYTSLVEKVNMSLFPAILFVILILLVFLFVIVTIFILKKIKKQ